MEAINIIIDKVDGAFVEVENDEGRCVRVGTFDISDPDYVKIRITPEDIKNGS